MLNRFWQINAIYRHTVLLLAIICILPSFAYAQKVNARYTYYIQKARGEIIVDGVLDEADWFSAQIAGNFHQVLPMDTSRAWARTEVRLTYDDRAIYMMAVCFDSLPGGMVVESMRRDFMFGRNDNFLVFIDPFEDQNNGFSFGANAAGAQWDGFMFDGGFMDLGWDNKWESAVKYYEGFWIFECAIPYKSIRYKKGLKEWGINFSRLDLKLNEKSAWAPVPRQFPTASLAYTGRLIWDAPPPDPGTNISIIPYIAGSSIGPKGSPEGSGNQFDFGADVKVSITPSLNLDLTVNPDFSQVEVDRQITNLSRFELFFPERRQFFLENSDLFASFGTREIRPFFSRRVGLNSPIHYGARLSGRVDRNWRVGLMNVQTGQDPLTGPQNYSVAAVQRRVFSRSNIAAMVVNRNATDFRPDADSSFSAYNRNVALEYNLLSSDNIWTGKIMFHKTFSPGVQSQDFTQAAHIQYNNRKLQMQWRHEYVGKNYNAEVGYVPRTGYFSVGPTIGYRFFPKIKSIVSHGPMLVTNTIFSPDMQLTDSESYINYSIEFLDRSEAGIWVSNDYIMLLDPFDPTNTDGEKLERGSDYRWNAFGVYFRSTQVNNFIYNLETRHGGYFGGWRDNVSGGAGYRFQPYGSISCDFSYNDIQMPEPFKSTEFWLVSPRLDITFTNTIFLTTFMQYNAQVDNINLNARFQWRFKPASDFFLVYTENYLPGDFTSKNRALVFKLTYWYNI
ncbi:MAG: carbohydrate binding family 9 domain-containing protein [Cyclobacteriaceae bacterium]|nr:carbohydrate binding family 9 domain-containing protein [Cyclobacteriaceae bacterium]